MELKYFSTATIWVLYALIKYPEIQGKLRSELLKVPSDSPSMDELNALPYLDAVVRETLRLLAPIPYTFRISVRNDVLPLNTPVQDRLGKKHHAIKSVEAYFFLYSRRFTEEL